MATAIPPNEARFTLRELAVATGAVFESSQDRTIRGISTDSRIGVEGKLFIALSGERFDGHAFVQDAVANGAAAVLVERGELPELPVPVLRAPSSLCALGDIAQLHRQKWPGRLVAVAGSAGKTTTRVAIETVLRSVLGDRVHATPGNLNNLVGVPMTLLGLTEQHEYAVVEVGTNFPGEVARLSAICSPNAAVLTLIGLEHTEGLGDLDGVEQEEGQVFKALEAGGIAVGNGDDPRVNSQLSQAMHAVRSVTFGCHSDLDYRTEHRVADALDRTLVTVHRRERVGGSTVALETRLLGLPGAMAVTAAVAVADVFGVSIDVERTNAALMRSDLGETGRLKAHSFPDGTVVLDDSYNANPPSMLSSIALANELARRRSSRLILVLGEMLELGQHSEREHTQLGTQLGRVAQLIAVGEQAELLHRSAEANSKKSELVPNAEAAARHLLRVIQPGDIVLVKGSRGVRLEIVVESVIAQKGFAS